MTREDAEFEKVMDALAEHGPISVLALVKRVFGEDTGPNSGAYTRALSHIKIAERLGLARKTGRRRSCLWHLA